MKKALISKTQKLVLVLNTLQDLKIDQNVFMFVVGN